MICRREGGCWRWGKGTALCHAWKRSPSCDAVFCAPGNVGISSSGDATCIPDLDIYDSSAVIAICRQWGVGPQAPLVSGLANNLVKKLEFLLLVHRQKLLLWKVLKTS
ncbi:hypothetical protein LWI29_033704 [Acer saccharum]|uniref:Phosphoribosylglycinamide synthetase N-terminal domain-containing protein n=1 Tax=Acer saccharum TaxID=4024 RepID=A0AA39SIQ6_ACESA|nr:hypothetical protein LWI29_033704 [Acer saccharum]